MKWKPPSKPDAVEWKLMANDVLLDTNIVIAVLRNDMAVKERLLSIESFFLPATVLGELFFGVHKSSRPAQELARLQALLTGLDESRILPCDHATAQVYGLIKQRLTSVGRPIPENDYWIAAVAYQYDLPIVTRDAHFREIEGITIEVW